jgi:hypothetical protein
MACALWGGPAWRAGALQNNPLARAFIFPAARLTASSSAESSQDEHLEIQGSEAHDRRATTAADSCCRWCCCSCCCCCRYCLRRALLLLLPPLLLSLKPVLVLLSARLGSAQAPRVVGVSPELRPWG